MKSISIRQLHENTGDWVRQASKEGEILVTDRGTPVARILPQVAEPEVPYFARRKTASGFKRLSASGKLRGGTDSTQAISADREEGE